MDGRMVNGWVDGWVDGRTVNGWEGGCRWVDGQVDGKMVEEEIGRWLG
jgi:hypothetical protein